MFPYINTMATFDEQLRKLLAINPDIQKKNIPRNQADS